MKNNALKNYNIQNEHKKVHVNNVKKVVSLKDLFFEFYYEILLNLIH